MSTTVTRKLVSPEPKKLSWLDIRTAGMRNLPGVRILMAREDADHPYMVQLVNSYADAFEDRIEVILLDVPPKEWDKQQRKARERNRK